MLRGSFKLTADMICYQLFYKGIVLVVDGVVKTHAASYKDLFYFGN